MKVFISVIITLLALDLYCLSQEEFTGKINKTTACAIDEVLKGEFRLKLSRDAILALDPTAMSALGGVMEAQHGDTARGQASEALVSRATLSDGAVYAGMYVIEEGRSSYAGYGWQIPIRVYKSCIGGIVAECRRHFAPVEPAKRVKTARGAKQERPCLVWDMPDRVVVLDWTPLHAGNQAGDFGLIQLVAIEKDGGWTDRMDRFLVTTTNDCLFGFPPNQ